MTEGLFVELTRGKSPWVEPSVSSKHPGDPRLWSHTQFKLFKLFVVTWPLINRAQLLKLLPNDWSRLSTIKIRTDAGVVISIKL